MVTSCDIARQCLQLWNVPREEPLSMVDNLFLCGLSTELSVHWEELQGTTMRVCAAHVARECEVAPIILMCLNTQPHDGAVWEGRRTFRKWRLIGGDISLEMALEL